MARATAEMAVDSRDRKLSKEQRDAGWSHFLEKTTIKPGTDPKTATAIRLQRSVMRRARVALPVLMRLAR